MTKQSYQNFAAIDFETANYTATSICSVGLVVVRDGETAHEFHSLVHPLPHYFLGRFTDIHGISLGDTEDAPLFREVWAEILPHIGDLPLVAHNKAFDERVLRATLKLFGIEATFAPFFCTLQAAKRQFPHLNNHQLPTVARHCGFELTNHHHALADAQACAAIMAHLNRP